MRLRITVEFDHEDVRGEYDGEVVADELHDAVKDTVGTHTGVPAGFIHVKVEEETR